MPRLFEILSVLPHELGMINSIRYMMEITLKNIKVFFKKYLKNPLVRFDIKMFEIFEKHFPRNIKVFFNRVRVLLGTNL